MEIITLILLFLWITILIEAVRRRSWFWVVASLAFIAWGSTMGFVYKANAATLTTSVSVTITDTPQIIQEAEYTAGVGVSAAVNLTTENAETTRLHEQSR